LFMNAMFWLAKMDTMIAISPTAMEVPRIRPMSETTQRVWRSGMLIGVLPLMVVVSGVLTWWRRRD
jgi:ABC-type uncharacterized transport system involved in gliding motility auxiliary subunit